MGLKLCDHWSDFEAIELQPWFGFNGSFDKLASIQHESVTATSAAEVGRGFGRSTESWVLNSSNTLELGHSGEHHVKELREQVLRWDRSQQRWSS